MTQSRLDWVQTVPAFSRQLTLTRCQISFDALDFRIEMGRVGTVAFCLLRVFERIER